MHQVAAWKRIPVEDLVPSETLWRAMAFDRGQYMYESTLRGLPLRWLAPSKRLLWMAAGLGS